MHSAVTETVRDTVRSALVGGSSAMMSNPVVLFIVVNLGIWFVIKVLETVMPVRRKRSKK